MKYLHTKILVFVFALTMIGCKQDSRTPKKAATGNEKIDLLTNEIEKNKNNPQAWYTRAQAWYDLADYDHAIVDLKHAIHLDTMNPVYYHLLADAYLDSYKSRDALETMKIVTGMHPRRIISHLKYAEIQYILKQYDNSITIINNILRMDPQNNEAYFMLGLNFMEMGQTDKAINSFQTAVELNPEMTDAWMLLAELHEKKGDADPLIFYNNAIQIAPDKPELLHAKAFYLQNHDRILEALNIYRQITVQHPSYEGALLNAGILYMEIDSLEKAFEQFNILTGLSPQNHLAHFYHGITNFRLGHIKEAEKDLHTCLNLKPDFQRAKDALDEIQKKRKEK